MAKRGTNEGSIFKRKDGRWVGSLNLGWEDGKRKRRHFYAATAGEVRDELLKARSDQSRGLPVPTERQTVAQFLDHWLKHTLKAKAKPRSHESFSAITRLHLNPTLGKIQLHKLTPQHVQKLLDDKSQPYKVKKKNGTEENKQGRSPQTVANIRTVLRSALAQALKWGLIARNSAALVNAPRITRKRIEPLDPEKARKLLEVAKGSRFEPIYLTTLTLGLRRGEVLGLRWSDVDMEQRTLHISQSVQRLLTGSDEKGKKSALQATETKTDGSRRSIALPDSVVKALKARRVKQAEERLAAGSEWKDCGLVFTTAIGRPLEPKVLHREYKSLLKTAKLPTSLRFHDLEAQRRLSAARARRPSARDNGVARPQFDNGHDERLRTCDARYDARCCRQNGCDSGHSLSHRLASANGNLNESDVSPRSSKIGCSNFSRAYCRQLGPYADGV